MFSDYELLERLFLMFSDTDKYKYIEQLRGKTPLTPRDEADQNLIDAIQRRLTMNNSHKTSRQES